MVAETIQQTPETQWHRWPDVKPKVDQPVEVQMTSGLYANVRYRPSSPIWSEFAVKWWRDDTR